MEVTLNKKTWVAHLAIWLSYLILMIWFYGEYYHPFEIPFFRSITIVLFQAGLFYLNFFVLLPRYFEKKKNIPYFFFTFLLLVAALAVYMIADHLYFKYEINRAISENDYSDLPRYLRDRVKRGAPHKFNPFNSRMIWRQVFFNGFFVVIVLFVSTIYRNLLVNQRKEKEALQLLSQVKEAESNLLKSQINPHFLFNTLNNIYSMAQLKSDNTPDAIHQLSDMLRYVIYECNENRVKLKHELNYIKSYIQLFLLKDEDMQHVKYDMKNADKNLKIAPLLLIPFIENSFKHSHIEDKENSWINIELNTNGNQLNLKVANSVPASDLQKDKTGGVGLENVKKRLSILYPDKHYLKIKKDKKQFIVELMIDLDEH